MPGLVGISEIEIEVDNVSAGEKSLGLGRTSVPRANCPNKHICLAHCH